MRKKLILVGLVVGLCAMGQAQSNTKGQGQTPPAQGQEKTTGADQSELGLYLDIGHANLLYRLT